MSKVAAVARLTARDGQRDALVEALGMMFDAVDGEPGTEVYALHRDDEDENVLWFYELYRDGDSLQAHSTSDTMKASGSTLGPLLAGRPEVHVLTPVRAKGLSLP